MSKNREFENIKTEAKIYALALWRDGKSIASIARDLQKSRETIYRWVYEGDKVLAKGRARTRTTTDLETKNKIIEAYILLKRPSIRRLCEALRNIYLIHLSESQVRRAIAKWGLSNFKASKVFDSLLKHQASLRLAIKKPADSALVAETSPKRSEHSSHPEI